MIFSKIFRNKFEAISIITVILTGVIAQNIVLFRGGMKGVDGYKFPSMHDTMWNIALAAELSNHFPPQHPGFAGEPLKNNHFFYPFLLAIVHKISGIGLIDLYFRIGPIIVSFIYGLSLYAVGTLFTASIIFRALAIFLGYFSGSFSYFLPIFYGSDFNWQGNTFLSDQPFDQLINPYSVLGFALMLLTIFISSKVTDNKGKLKIKSVMVLALLVGLTYGFKSFGGIILIGSLTLSCLLLIPRQKNLILIFILAQLIFLPVFFLITEVGKSNLKFVPGWLLTEMMVKNDGLNLSNFVQIESYYQNIGNNLGLFKIKLIELAIYLAGNLGTRILGLILIIKLLLNDKSRNIRPLFSILITVFCILLSITIPLLFNLGANAHNIVQFTPYSLVLLSVLTVVFLENIYQLFKSRHKKNIGIIFVLTIVILSVPVNIKNIITKIEIPNETVSYSEFEGLTYLKNSSRTDDVILIDPRQYAVDPIYVSALSQRRIYLASPDYARQTNRDPSKRLTSIYEYFDGAKSLQETIDIEIDYIYLHLPYNDGFISKAQKDGYKKLYDNKRVIILEKIKDYMSYTVIND